MKIKSARSKALITSIAFVLLFFLTRLVVLLNSPRIMMGHEERITGVLGLHLERGLMLPAHFYQYEECSGGTFIVGWMAHLPYQLFGPTYFALKLVPLFFSLIMLIALYWGICKWFGQKAALFFGLAFIFAPSFFIERSLVAFGNHMEAATLMVLGLLLFDRAQSAVKFKFRLLWLIFFGLLSGFSVYFDYQFLILLFVLLPFGIAASRSPGRFAAELCVFLAAFRIGLIPWYRYHEGQYFTPYIIKYFFGRHPAPDEASIFERIFAGFKTFGKALDSWFRSGDFSIGNVTLLDDGLVNNLLIWVFLACFGYVVWRSRNRVREVARGIWPKGRQAIEWNPEYILAIGVLYVPFHFFLFSVFSANYPTDMLPPYRYLHPVFIFYFIAIAVTSTTLLESKRFKLFAVIWVMILAGGIGGNLHHLKNTKPEQVTQMPGYSYAYFYGPLQMRYDLDVNDAPFLALAMERFPGRDGPYYEGAIVGAAFLYGVDVTRHLDHSKEYEPFEYESFAAGLGCSDAISVNPPEKQRNALRKLVDEKWIPAFEEGRKMGFKSRNNPG